MLLGHSEARHYWSPAAVALAQEGKTDSARQARRLHRVAHPVTAVQELVRRALRRPEP